MENGNSTGKVIASLILGVTIGSVLGILFAPDNGRSTRKKILGKKDELAQAVRDQFNDLMDSVKTGVDHAKSGLDSAKDEINQAKY
jgi:gas vesicle protein